ncbi:insulin-like growth factor I [Austrofundulus limnaeus]|uniref:Insulin-like growth factor I n=1 Tax=Austrofundulus limnaeus TaxID=52670 RepID=A0A2I4CJL9_AUSLI|nr:PREDICTED: insulin-like growth factor I [Austrofundulus limnaeus]
MPSSSSSSSSSSSHPTRLLTLKVLCVRIGLCLLGWPGWSEAARIRCGSELLGDLIFVCGDRGIYLGKGSWSGYGPRPRGKGIVDRCCKSSGCELQFLEMYCAKPKTKMMTTTTAATTTTHPTTSTDLFQAVFQKRLLETLGAPDSPRRDAYRKKTPPSSSFPQRASSPRRRTKTQLTTGPPTSVSVSPL